MPYSSVLNLLLALSAIGGRTVVFEPDTEPVSADAEQSARRLPIESPQRPELLPGRLSAEVFELVGVSVTARDLQQLCAAADLRVLHLQSCPLCPDKCTIVVCARELMELQLIDARLTDMQVPVLASLPKLQQLDLRGNPVTDAGLAVLAKLPQLEILDLRGTLVTLNGVNTLQSLRPDLRILRDAADQASQERVRQTLVETVCE